MSNRMTAVPGSSANRPTARRTTAVADWQQDAAPVESLGTLRRRCAAAAALILDRETFTAEDRADCAATILAGVMAEIGARAPRCYCGGRADWRAPIMDDHGDAIYVPAPRYLRCYAHRGGTAPRPIIRRGAADDIPAAAAPTFRRLTDRARNYREAEIRRRDHAERERDAAARRHAMGGGDVREEIFRDETAGTPHAARRRAVELLREIGAMPRRTPPRRHSRRRYRAAVRRREIARVELLRAVHGPKPDAPTRAASVTAYMRRIETALYRVTVAERAARRYPLARVTRATPPPPALWAMAYAAARSSDGMESPEIAAELETDTNTLAKYIRRAADGLRAGHEGTAVPLRWPTRRPPYGENGHREPAERVSWHAPRRHAAARLCADLSHASGHPAGLPTGDRYAPGDALPNVPDAPVPDAPALRWDIAPMYRGAPLPATPPRWARELMAGPNARRATAQRLAAAAAGRSVAAAAGE